jgi:hypothetical protein
MSARKQSPHAALADLLVTALEPCLREGAAIYARMRIEATLATVAVRRDSPKCSKPKFHRGRMKTCGLVPGHPGQCQAAQ